ncbi:MAG: hypothetical protein FJZ08_03040, partial [Candidatus Omnitrophica bacterium]|nr:hypothetical protein [Candidatus Omnitrophota bacterium]
MEVFLGKTTVLAIEDFIAQVNKLRAKLKKLEAEGKKDSQEYKDREEDLRVLSNTVPETIASCANVQNILDDLARLEDAKVFWIEDHIAASRRAAIESLLEGEWFIQKAAGGAANRMQKSLKGIGITQLTDKDYRIWNLDIWFIAQALKDWADKQNLDEVTDESLRSKIEQYRKIQVPAYARYISLGQRHMEALRDGVTSLGKAYNLTESQVEIIRARLKILIQVNDDIDADVEAVLIENDFFGFNPENILLVKGGYGPVLKARSGKLVVDRVVYDTWSHGFAFESLAWTQPYTIDKEGNRHYSLVPAFDYLRGRGVKYGLTQRINDLIAMYPEQAIDIDMMEAFLKLKENENCNVYYEMMKNPTGQKGGLGLTRDPERVLMLLVEGLTVKTVEADKRMAELNKKTGGIPYNRLYGCFDIQAVLEAITQTPIPMSIKIKDGTLSPEIPTGDITYLPGIRALAGVRKNDVLLDEEILDNEKVETDDPSDATKKIKVDAYVKGKGAVIHDCKEEKNIPNAIKLTDYLDARYEVITGVEKREEEKLKVLDSPEVRNLLGERIPLKTLLRYSAKTIAQRAELVRKYGLILNSTTIRLARDEKLLQTWLVAKIKAETGYELTILERQGYIVYHLADTVNHFAFEVVPTRGNTIVALEVEIDGKMTNVLYAPDITKSGGIPVMWPFANRIRAGKFSCAGREVDLNGVAGTKDDGKGNIYHGMVRYERWSIERIGVNKAGVYIRASLDTRNYPEIAKYFGQAKITVIYSLNGGQLGIETIIENKDQKDIPMSLAFHPWFNAPSRSGWQVRLPASRHWQAVEQLPTGELEDVTETAFDLADRAYDDVFTGLNFVDGLATTLLRSADGRLLISISQDRAFPHIVFYAPLDKEVICVEPQSSATDAFNLRQRGIKEAGAIILNPGEVWRGNIKLAATKQLSIRRYATVQPGLEEARVEFSSEGRSAQGRAVKINPEEIELGLWFADEAVTYDFSRNAQTEALAMSQHKEYRPFPGRRVEDYIEEEPGLVFAVNGQHGNFWEANTLLVINGQLISKPVCGIMQDVFVPLNGIFYIFILDKGQEGIRVIHLVDGKSEEDISDIRYGVAGPPLVMGGEDISDIVRQAKPATNSTEIALDPKIDTFSFSAIGRDREGRIIQLSMVGNPEAQPELFLSEIAKIMQALGVIDAILLGTSVDVQQYVEGSTEELLKGRARRGSTTGLEYEKAGGRQLGSMIIGSSVLGEEIRDNQDRPQAILVRAGERGRSAYGLSLQLEALDLEPGQEYLLSESLQHALYVEQGRITVILPETDAPLVLEAGDLITLLKGGRVTTEEQAVINIVSQASDLDVVNDLVAEIPLKTIGDRQTPEIVKSAQGELLALVLRGDIEFEKYAVITNPGFALGIGTKSPKQGEIGRPHIHNPIEHPKVEILMVVRGRARVIIYNSQKERVDEVILEAGDKIISLAGHNVEFIGEDNKMIEVVEGPYLGPDQAKTFFEDTTNIAKGKGISHPEVNDDIKQAGMVWIYGRGPQVKLSDDREYLDRRSVESAYIEEALRIIAERGFPELAEFIRRHVNIIAVIPRSSIPFLLSFEDENHLQVLHVGLTRRAIYIPEGLYDAIKASPALLASAIIHDGYELEQWVRAYEIERNRGFNGTIQEFRDRHFSLMPLLHIKARQHEETIAGISSVVQGSCLDEVIHGLIDDYYRRVTYSAPEKEIVELVRLLVEHYGELLENYMAKVIGVTSVTIRGIREIYFVGKGTRKMVYRVSFDTDRGHQALGIRFINRDDIENAQLAKEEVRLFSVFYRLDQTISLQIREYWDMHQLAREAPTEVGQRMRELADILGFWGVTFGEFIHGFTLDKLPEEDKLRVYRKNVELLVKAWFLTWEERYSLSLKEDKGWSINDMKPENFIYSYRFDLVLFVDLDQAERMKFSQFMRLLLIYIADLRNYGILTGLGFINARREANREVVREVLVKGFVGAVGAVDTETLFRHFLKTVKPRSNEGLIITAALEELEGLSSLPIIPLDASSRGKSREQVNAEIRTFGGIDAIINNFGVLKAKELQRLYGLSDEAMECLSSLGIRFIRGPPELGTANYFDPATKNLYLIVPADASGEDVEHE